MDEEGLEQAGAGALAECVCVELLDERCPAGGIRRRHAGAAVGYVRGIARGRVGVDTHTVGDEIGLDAPVVAGAPALNVLMDPADGGRTPPTTASFAAPTVTMFFSEGIEGDRLEASLCGEGALILARRPEGKIIWKGSRKSVKASSE